MRAPRRLVRYMVVVAFFISLIYIGNYRASNQYSLIEDEDFGDILDREKAKGGGPTKGNGKVGMDKFVKSGFDWSRVALRYPIDEIKHLPTGRPQVQPRIQHKFSKKAMKISEKVSSQRKEVKRVFQKCWRNYRNYAWMRDELTPITGEGKDTFGGWAATMIDALDTLWIMGLKEDFYEAVEAVATVSSTETYPSGKKNRPMKICFNCSKICHPFFILTENQIDWEKTESTACNMFETTIRHLGGLLSAYDLSHEKVLLLKAIELGDMLYMGFDTPNRMPGFWLNFAKAKAGNLVADDHLPSASPCSLSLEFTRLAQLTGDPKYYEAVSRITDLLERTQNSTRLPGMWPTFIDLRDLKFTETTFTVGALADSLYEYLPKMHALLGGLEPVYAQMAKFSLETISKNLLFRPMVPDKADVLFSGNVHVMNDEPHLIPEMQHLTCFIGGMFALSGRLFGMEEYVTTGAKLTQGCIYAYSAFPLGIMPEISTFYACSDLSECEFDEETWKEDVGSLTYPKGVKSARDLSYILRPEAIESVFLLWRITGEEKYRESAWGMFESIMRATETEFGNARISDVTMETPEKVDSMEVCFPPPGPLFFVLLKIERDKRY